MAGLLGVSPAANAADPLPTIPDVQAGEDGWINGLVPAFVVGGTAGSMTLATEGGAAAGAGFCAGTAGVGCVVIGAAVVGGVAYMTRDMWWPWVEQHFGGESTGSGGGVYFTGSWADLPHTGEYGPGDMLPQMLLTFGGRADEQNLLDGGWTVTCRTRALDAGSPWSDWTVYTVGQAHALGQAYGQTKLVDVPRCGPEGSSVVEYSQISYSGTPHWDWHGDGNRVMVSWEAAPAPETLTYTSTVHCKDPSTGATVTVTRTYTGGIGVGTCPDGTVPTSVDIGVQKDTGTQTNVGTINLQDPSTGTDYPLCVQGGVGVCKWAVWVDGSTCSSTRAGCLDWTRTNRSTPERVRCHYGPYEVSVDRCFWLERAYEGQPIPQTTKNTDGNPDTWDPPRPVWLDTPIPTATGTATASPTVTSSPSPTVSGTPSSSPSPSSSTPTPTPTVTPEPPVCAAVAGYNLGPVQAVTATLVADVAPRFGITTVYGYRQSDPYPDHPSGLAADFMVGTDTVKGDDTAAYVIANAKRLNVDYILWNQQSWNPQRGTWQPMEDRGSDTANHKDHVHVTVNPTVGGGQCGGTPGGAADPQSAECFPSGWGMFNPAEWVLKPVKCALTWAFKPDPAVVTSIKADAGKAWDESTPGRWAGAIGGLGAGFHIAAADCRGPALHFAAWKVDTTIYPANACTAPASTVAAVSRFGIAALGYVGGALACVRLLMAGFGYSMKLGDT